MSDRHDAKIRELTYRLIQMAPQAPPFPEETMVQLRPSPSSQSTPTRRRSPLLLVGLAAAAVLLVVGIPLLISRMSGEPAPPATSTPQTTVPNQTTVVPPPGDATRPVTLYFVGDPISPDQPAPVLVPVQRIVSPVVAEDTPPAEATNGDYLFAAIQALIEGPTDAEIALYPSLGSEIPDGTAVLSQTVGADTAGAGAAQTRYTVDLSSEFESGGGSATMFARLTQVVFTATQFPDATEVVFEIEGEPVDVFSGEGIVLDGPQTRADYLDQGIVGPVFVDSPIVGATVSSPFTIRGIANVFEATVSYEVTAGSTVLAGGFTNATCGTGCWGDYSVEIEYALDVDAEGLVTVFTDSPQDGRRIQVVSYPVTLLANAGSPDTTLPPDTIPVGDGPSFDVDPTVIDAVPTDGTVVVSAVWGDGAGEAGVDPSGFGPCCFDVTGDGSIVLNDVYNSRIVVYPPSGPPRVLATFDPGDFVPDGIATDGSVVFVIGMTNRAGRPYDLLVLDLAGGDELARAETSLTINTDLRFSSDGSLYAGRADSRPTWTRLTDGVTPLAADEQTTTAYLPGETSLSVAYDAGVEIVALPAGDSPATTFDLPTELLVWDVMTYPGSPDANGVLVWLTPGMGGPDPSTLLFLGSQNHELRTAALSIDMPRERELGTFNTARYAFGGVYVMSATSDELVITRYELP